MRKNLFLLITLFIFGCQNATTPLEPVPVFESGEVELKFGKWVVIQDEGIKIKFIDVEDGRCPILMHCVWAGNAWVTIKIDDHEINLNTYTDPQKAITSSYKIELLSLNPYPVDSRGVDKKDYVVSLFITKE